MPMKRMAMKTTNCWVIVNRDVIDITLVDILITTHVSLKRGNHLQPQESDVAQLKTSEQCKELWVAFVKDR
ncbi:hypothetical protein E2C01_045599 [Portunus trituberculatus]|uniref:Uncharacterized protein n=1 Tax=Portunus trituberculatus TaxID=210409 RepID=A0A5B7G1M0_PORTR|nr:hypothetical protein [Portunus trituberculatus]